MKSIKKSTKVILALIGLCLVLSIAHGYIGFVNTNIEDWFQFCINLIVAILTVTYLSFKSKRIYSIIALVILIPLFLPYMALVVLTSSDGYLTQLQSIPFDDLDVVVYQTNCGAACSYGLWIRTEKKYFFNTLQTLNTIRSFGKAYDIELEKVSDSEVKVTDLKFYEERDERYSGKKPEVGEVWNIRDERKIQ